MTYYMFVAVQDDDKVAVLTMDGDTGKLTPKADVAVSGAPSLLAINPSRTSLYVRHRGVPEISSWRIDDSSGSLTKIGSVSPESAPAFIATDRKGKYLLSSHYQSGHAQMRLGLGVDAITQSIYVHPAMPEVVQRAFGQLRS